MCLDNKTGEYNGHDKTLLVWFLETVLIDQRLTRHVYPLIYMQFIQIQ